VSRNRGTDHQPAVRSSRQVEQHIPPSLPQESARRTTVVAVARRMSWSAHVCRLTRGTRSLIGRGGQGFRRGGSDAVWESMPQPD